MSKEKMVYRTQGLKVRNSDVEEGKKYIEGYFVMFNDPTQLWEGAYEQVAEGAIDLDRDVDVKALSDHDSSKVLGRTTSKTLQLNLDKKGLYAKIEINQKDTDALNLHARVERGDISQCSFGFYVEDEDVEEREDGSTLFTIKKLKLIEVSVVTFPAYSNTSVEARHKDFYKFKERMLENWKKRQKEKLNGSFKSIITKK